MEKFNGILNGVGGLVTTLDNSRIGALILVSSLIFAFLCYQNYNLSNDSMNLKEKHFNERIGDFKAYNIAMSGCDSIKAVNQILTKENEKLLKILSKKSTL